MAVTVNVRDVLKRKKELGNLPKKISKGVQYALSDVKKSAPGWIASEVVEVYNIKKSEITPSSTNRNRRLAGGTKVRVSGDTISSLQIKYVGKPLTPTHFGMRPKTPPKPLKKKMLVPADRLKLKQKKGKGKASRWAYVPMPKKYFVTLEILRGQPKIFKGDYDTPPFLASGGSGYLPFQRTGRTTKPFLHVAHTISVPQMVSSDRTEDNIQKRIAELTYNKVEQRVSSQIK